MAEVSLKVSRAVRVSEVVEVPAGETQLVIRFPEPVPAGKVLQLRVEVSGNIADAPAP
jgi:acyl dehydratase